MERLYEQDAYLRTFTARVLTCREVGGRWQIGLDRTAFYPEGGGQPWDTGTLEDAAVQEVHARGEDVLHTTDRPLTPGQTVTGRIDWARRFDHMQQHSAEHICSGLICRQFECENVGFHLGRETVTIDFTAPIALPQLLQVQEEANAYIAADVPTQIHLMTPRERQDLVYRSKKELPGPMRMVAFPGADVCACCGTHVKSSAQIGLVKFLSVQPFRGGSRVEMAAGGRAVSLLCRVYEHARLAGRALSVPPEGIESAVGRALQELERAHAQARQWEEIALPALAEPWRGKGQALLIRPPMAGDSLRRLGQTLSEVCGGAAAVFAGEEGAYRYVLAHAGGADLAPLAQRVKTALHARGGGRGGFYQGTAPCRRAQIETLFREV